MSHPLHLFLELLQLVPDHDVLLGHHVELVLHLETRLAIRLAVVMPHVHLLRRGPARWSGLSDSGYEVEARDGLVVEVLGAILVHRMNALG